MGETRKKSKTMSAHGFTQFELTTNIVKNLKQFNITPVTKLVLTFLTTCYNEEQNGAVVFPSMPYIADNLGIGLTQTKQAIKDLINEGLIIKSKRDKINGNYNKYLLTLKVQNSTSERSENEFSKQSDSDLSMIRTNNMNKEKTNVVCLKTQKEEIQDREILIQYAKEKRANNIEAYVNSLIISGASANIIQQYKEKEKISKYWNNQAQKTSELVKECRNFEGDEPSEKFKALKGKLLG